MENKAVIYEEALDEVNKRIIETIDEVLQRTPLTPKTEIDFSAFETSMRYAAILDVAINTNVTKLPDTLKNLLIRSIPHYAVAIQPNPIGIMFNLIEACLLGFMAGLFSKSDFLEPIDLEYINKHKLEK